MHLRLNLLNQEELKALPRYILIGLTYLVAVQFLAFSWEFALFYKTQYSVPQVHYVSVSVFHTVKSLFKIVDGFEQTLQDVEHYP